MHQGFADTPSSTEVCGAIKPTTQLVQLGCTLPFVLKTIQQEDGL